MTLRPARLGLLLAVCAAAMLQAGCYSEGGLGWSEDQYVYASRTWQPWTVTIRDTRTGQEFWSIDVPVGKQLVIHFLEGEGSGGFTPDIMEWAIMEDGKESGELSSRLPVPPSHSRRLEPHLRPVPELPPDMVAGGGRRAAPVNPGSGSQTPTVPPDKSGPPIKLPDTPTTGG